MRFALTSDQLEIADGAAALLRARCTPDALRAAWESPTGMIDGLWGELGELGLLGLMVPETHGGLGMGAVELVAVLREAGYVGAPGPLVETTMVVAPMLAVDANTERADLLATVISGKTVATAALAPDSATVPAVPYAVGADAAVIVRPDARTELLAGFTATPVATVDGVRGLGHLTGASTAPLPNPDGAAFARAALGTAAMLVGLANRCLDLAVDYAKQRQQFGVAIGSFQAVKHHLANAKLQAAFAGPAVLEAAAAHDAGLATWQRSASMAKVLASQAAERVSELALQTHGAIGYTVEYDLHLYMKRAWALARSWGTVSQHLELVARATLD